MEWCRTHPILILAPDNVKTVYTFLITRPCPFMRWICPCVSVTFSSFWTVWSLFGSLNVLYRHHLFQAKITLCWCWAWLKANLAKGQLCPAPPQEVFGTVFSCDLTLLLRLWLTTFHTAPSCICSGPSPPCTVTAIDAGNVIVTWGKTHSPGQIDRAAQP